MILVRQGRDFVQRTRKERPSNRGQRRKDYKVLFQTLLAALKSVAFKSLSLFLDVLKKRSLTRKGDMFTTLLACLALLGGANALLCYKCSHLKRSKNNTCTDQYRETEDSGKDDDDTAFCRLLTLGNQVVEQGMLPEALCSNESLTVLKLKLK